MTLKHSTSDTGGERVIMTHCPYCERNLEDELFTGHWRYCPYNPEQVEKEDRVDISGEGLSEHYRDVLAPGEHTTAVAKDIAETLGDDVTGLGVGNVLANLQRNPEKAARLGMHIRPADDQSYCTSTRWRIEHMAETDGSAATDSHSQTAVAGVSND